MTRYFSIDGPDGTNLCGGIQLEHRARETAQRHANDLGEPVRLYSNDPDDRGEIIEPEEHGPEETHWGYGSGMPGCLFDNGPHFAETQEQAIDAALWIFQAGSEGDLTEEEHAQAVADLKSDGIHYFPAERRGELGAYLVQVWEEQGPCPESDE